MNNVKTVLLLGLLSGLLLAGGQAAGGRNGLVMGLVMAVGMNFFSYFFSDKLVLRMYRAQIVTEKEAPELYRMVDRLRQRAGQAVELRAQGQHHVALIGLVRVVAQRQLAHVAIQPGAVDAGDAAQTGFDRIRARTGAQLGGQLEPEMARLAVAHDELPRPLLGVGHGCLGKSQAWGDGVSAACGG